MKISQRARNAIFIGSLCTLSYLAVYIARNLLSAVTPQMIELGYTEAYIGKISSLYFMLYAIGQLINGAIGDKIKAKWMISVGLLGASVINLLFPFMTSLPTAAMIVYASSGFFLSMIYGPMTKVVSENTEPIHATRCMLGFTFASFFGTPMAGILASFLDWKIAFLVSSMALLIMSAVCVFSFLRFEKKGVVRYNQYAPPSKGIRNIPQLFQYNIIKFSLIALITGIVRTSVVFWLPTYLSQHLHFASDVAARIFTGATLLISLTTFVAVFIYERLRHNMNLTILLMFSCAVGFFLLTYLVTHPVINIIAIVLAIMSSNGAAAMLYSRWLPSLRDTGMVSSVTGYIDFLSYMSAAAANLVFANAATTLGWGNLILIWLGLMVLGVIIALPYKRKKHS